VSIEEPCHNFVRLLRFRQVRVIPECVRQGFENNQLCVNASMQESSMEDRCSAEEQVARAGDEQ
jgi:hypothetical protein